MNFLSDAIKQKENRMKYLKCSKKVNGQHRLLYPVKLCFKSEGEGLSTTTKNGGNSLPAYLPQKKCSKKFFRQKQNNIDQKLGCTLKRRRNK